VRDELEHDGLEQALDEQIVQPRSSSSRRRRAAASMP
jgi:hypothetical protein